VSDKYKDKSDFEINKRVAELLGISAHSPKHKLIDDAKVHTKEKGSHKLLGYSWKDYCNNWSDIGPIIEEYRIGMLLGSETEAVVAQGPKGDPFVRLEGKEKIKRAAAIVFILMMEAKDKGVSGE